MFVSILHVFEPKETSHLVLERGLVQGQRLMKCYYKIDCAKIKEIGNYWLEIYLRESWIESDITSIVRACQCSYPTSIRLQENLIVQKNWIEGDITSIIRACQCSYPISIRLQENLIVQRNWIEGDITSIIRACQCSYPISIRPLGEFDSSEELDRR